MHGKKEYDLQIRKFKQALNHRLVLKKLHKITKLNQEAWLKPYTNLKGNFKTNFEKDFFKLINNAVFEKSIGNVRKHRDIKKMNYLVSKPNNDTIIFFPKIY